MMIFELFIPLKLRLNSSKRNLKVIDETYGRLVKFCSQGEFKIRMWRSTMLNLIFQKLHEGSREMKF